MAIRALLLALALSLLEHASRADTLPYRAHRGPVPLDTTQGVPERGTSPHLPAPEHARRPIELGLRAMALPLDCAETTSRCRAHSVGGIVGYRLSPYFAWELVAEHTVLPDTSVDYLGPTMRVYASQRGTLDPFLEFGIGGERVTRTHRLALASELGGGIGILVSDRFRLSPQLKLRQSSHQRASCRSLRACTGWYGLGERWLMVGLSLDLWLGDEH